MAVSNHTRGGGSTEKKMTPEIYFARKLASNDKKIRDKTLKKLRKWISARSSVPDALNEDELMKLWKGLFYCMWMSDKPLIQEDLAEMISSLVHCVADRKTGLRFIEAALKTMARDWGGIDVWRMDKFLMFVRRIVRHSLEYVANEGWKEEEVALYSEMLSNTIVNANPSTTILKIPIGLQLHITNLFPEELAKAGGSGLSSAVVLKFLEPFVKCLATSNDFRLRKDIIEHVFIYLIKQSNEGIEYEEGGSSKSSSKRANKIGKKEAQVVEDEAQKNSEDLGGSDEDENGDESDDQTMDDEEGNLDWGAKDPRAGGVDVVLPQLKPEYTNLASMLFQMGSDKTVRSKNRKAMYRLVQWFKDLAAGVYPLAVQMPEVGPGLTPKMMKKAKKEFINDELALAEQRALEKENARKEKKLVQEALLNNSEANQRNGNNCDNEDGDDDVDSDEMDDSDRGSEDDDDYSDIEEEADTESNDEEEVAQEITNSIPSKVTAKENTLSIEKVKRIAQTFKPEDDWDDDASTTPDQDTKQAVAQLKKKLKASKRPLSSGWTESPLKKEVEIVIPNKRAKTKKNISETLQNDEDTPNGTNSSRRVKIVLYNNTAQDPKDYQESIRKSPGLPHDPDRQPSRGGVLKRTSATQAQKLAFDPPQRKARARKV